MIVNTYQLEKITRNKRLNMEKNIYLGLILLSIFFLITSFFSYKQVNESDLSTQQVVLVKSKWQQSKDYKKGDTYWLELQFQNIEQSFKVTNEDYERLKKADFKAEIYESDTLTIKYQGSLIYYFAKDGKEYTALNDANLDRKNTFNRVILISLSCLFIFFLLLKIRI